MYSDDLNTSFKQMGTLSNDTKGADEVLFKK